jgi:purine-binding chemotaxis protein CheW
MEQAGQLVVFTLGGESYGLPIGQVQEIIRYLQPRTMSASDHSVLGVISLRGRIVPVYDLAAKLGLHGSAEAAAENAMIVIVAVGEELAGIVVDAVEEVLSLDDVAFDELPMGAAAAFDKIARIEDRLIVVLSGEALLGVEVPALRAVAAA